MNEHEAMGRALELAWRGWGRVHPNPLVGAVVLDGGAVVAEGWHSEYGGPHAESAVLAAAGDRARGATLVVTLEPCAHQGKQPPCTGAVLESGVRRVVVALPDPNPLARGGARLLRQRGVQVEVGLRGDEACAQNAAFLHGLLVPDRPFVALKLATSLDGRIADHGGRSRWISGSAAREYVHWLRAGFEAIGVGGRTARADDPSLTVRGGLTPRVPPVRVVFDRTADLPPELALIRSAGEAPTAVVASSAAPAPALRSLEARGVRTFPSAGLADGLRRLREAGIGSLLVEGGGRLAGALLSAGLVDRLYWIQAPLWLGEGAVPAVEGVPGASLDGAPRWTVVERRPLGDDTLLVVDRTGCLLAS